MAVLRDRQIPRLRGIADKIMASIIIFWGFSDILRGFGGREDDCIRAVWTKPEVGDRKRCCTSCVLDYRCTS
jgi:hypothetical protein